MKLTYRRHHSLSFEPSPHPVVDTLGLSPTRIDTFVGITLVAVEAFRICAGSELA